MLTSIPISLLLHLFIHPILIIPTHVIFLQHSMRTKIIVGFSSKEQESPYLFVQVISQRTKITQPEIDCCWIMPCMVYERCSKYKPFLFFLETQSTYCPHIGEFSACVLRDVMNENMVGLSSIETIAMMTSYNGYGMAMTPVAQFPSMSFVLSNVFYIISTRLQKSIPTCDVVLEHVLGGHVQYGSNLNWQIKGISTYIHDHPSVQWHHLHCKSKYWLVV